MGSKQEEKEEVIEDSKEEEIKDGSHFSISFDLEALDRSSSDHFG